MRQRWYRVYFEPAFLICAAVLAIAGGGMSFAKKRLSLFLEKEPLPPKKSLRLLDESSLWPYKVLSKEQIEYQEVVKVLGTGEYIQWVLEDPGAGAESSVRYCSLFVTYYDVADRVPHVPDECYMGAGYQRLGNSEEVVFKAKKKGAETTIRGRYVRFSSPDMGGIGGGNTFLVMYLFNVNGEYAGSRTDARIIMNRSLLSRYSYYSKVEWKFFNKRLGRVVYPTKEQAILASRKLLGTILPVLEREHWPELSGSSRR